MTCVELIKELSHHSHEHYYYKEVMVIVQQPVRCNPIPLTKITTLI